jgi:hypothetical protein
MALRPVTWGSPMMVPYARSCTRSGWSECRFRQWLSQHCVECVRCTSCQNAVDVSFYAWDLMSFPHVTRSCCSQFLPRSPRQQSYHLVNAVRASASFSLSTCCNYSINSAVQRCQWLHFSDVYPLACVPPGSSSPTTPTSPHFVAYHDGYNEATSMPISLIASTKLDWLSLALQKSIVTLLTSLPCAILMFMRQRFALVASGVFTGVRTTLSLLSTSPSITFSYLHDASAFWQARVLRCGSCAVPKSLCKL